MHILRNRTLSALALLATASILSCAGLSCAGSKPNEDFFAVLPQPILEKVNKAVFEVVVPREASEELKFNPDPMEKSPFYRRNDPYLSIGTAFLVSPNHFVTAAHVLQVDAPTLYKDLKIRDVAGKLYTPTQITKYSDYRDLVEFSVAEPPAGVEPLSGVATFDVGQTIFVIGNTNGEGITYRSGQLGPQIAEPVEGRWKYLRFYAPIAGGASGGPLVNERGEVMGIVVMRNAVERVNFAVPIAELNGLSTKRAEFFKKDLRLATAPKLVEKTWEFGSPLPDSPDELAAKAWSSLSSFLTSEIAQVRKDPDEFPNEKHFRAYLTSQELHAGMAIISSDKYGKKWKLTSIADMPSSKPKDLKTQLTLFKNLGYLPVIAKADGPIAEFNSNPSRILNSLIQADQLSLGEAVETARSKLVSAGKPASSELWVDHLGRSWLSAAWYYHDANMGIALSCTPVPSGSACLVDMGIDATLAIRHIIRPFTMDRIIVSYTGTLAEWLRYMSDVDSDRIPAVLRTAHVTFTRGESLKAALGEFKYDIQSKDLSEETKLEAAFGFSMGDELGIDLLRVRVMPDVDKPGVLSLRRYFSPSDLSPDGHKSQWRKFAKKIDPFDGNVDKESGKKLIARLISEPSDMKAVPETPQTGVAVLCYTGEKLSDDEVKSYCAPFLSGAGLGGGGHP